MSSNPAVAGVYRGPVIGQTWVLLAVQAAGVKHDAHLTLLKPQAQEGPW